MKVLLIFTLSFLTLPHSALATDRKIIPSISKKKVEGMFVELKGTIQSGMMAIGGETTGTTLTTEGGDTYELLMGDKKLLSHLPKNNAVVQVKGLLTQVRGVEVQMRKILKVSELKVIQSPQ